MATTDILSAESPAQKDVLRAWWKKVTISNSKSSTGNSADVSSEATSVNRVFGLPLSESILYAHTIISYIDKPTGNLCYGLIPTIIAKCGSFLKKQGLMVEGIFRMSGSARRIATLQSVFNESEDYGANFNWEDGGYTVHDAANVMRRFLNHLPEPVITLDYYRPFKDTMNEEFPTLDAKVEAFQNLIECLPLVHQYLLMYIMDILELFSMTVDETRMDISALAAVFAPGILSHPDDELNPAGYKESQRVLEFLIEHQRGFTMPRSFILPGGSLISRFKAVSQRFPSTSSSNQSRPGLGPLSRRSKSSVTLITSGSKLTSSLSSPKLPLDGNGASRRPSLPNSPKPGSPYISNENTGSKPSLKRALTVPTKHSKDQPDVSSASAKKGARTWKSIRRIPEERTIPREFITQNS